MHLLDIKLEAPNRSYKRSIYLLYQTDLLSISSLVLGVLIFVQSLKSSQENQYLHSVFIQLTQWAFWSVCVRGGSVCVWCVCEGVGVCEGRFTC